MKRKIGWTKRLVAFALSAAVGLGAVPFSGFAPQEAYAAEMKGISQSHWAWESMQKMYDQGILSGDAAGNMHPDRAVTRAEFISMLNRSFNYTNYTAKELPFTDMTGEEWYAEHIRAAYAQGYFSGVSADRAGATEAITREAAAAMLCRNVKVENATLQLTQFTDGNKVSQWARGAVAAAVDKGYLKGYEDGTFRPKNHISRAEAATMLSNALGSILAESGTYSGVYEGNVTISTSNVTLKDVVISGDLYITEGVGTGYVNLENVTVLGEVIVCGGGEAQWGGNSVQFKHCNIQKLTVDGAEDRAVSLYALGDTTIAETNIKSTTYLQNHADTVPGFDNVRVFGPEETTLYLSGNFKMVDLVNPQNKVVLGKGEVEQLTVDEDAKEGEVELERGTIVKTLNVDGQSEITGKGDIKKLVVTASDATIEQFPDQIEIRPGVKTEIAGQEMSSADAAESSETPRILAGYPKANEISSSSAKVKLSGNKPGTIYWAVTYGDVKELTQEEILKPTTVERIQKSGTLSATESEKELEIALSSLEADAEFTVSAVLVDNKENVSRIKEGSFRTKDATKPGFVNGYPKTVPISSHRFDIEAMPLKDGTIYWAVFAKGAAQPTAYQLRSQELKGAIVYGKRADCERNVEYIMKAEHDDLVEDVSYDVYVMVSDGDQDSAIIKLTGVTKDTTPPEFLEGTPAQAKNEAKSVNVTVGSNEEGKVYYVVVDWDDSFPLTMFIDGELKQPELDSDEAKQQVLTGNDVKKAGSAVVKADTPISVTISGLEEETPYRVYMVLEDKSGNLSEEVKMLEIKTKDVTPPTAYVTCDNPIDGKMPVEEPIKIVFSEIVWNVLAKGSVVVSGENLTDEVLKLYDVTAAKEEEVTIDFNKVTNETGEKGATILVFPPEAFNSGKGLNSGSRYQFVLNNIVDTSGNAIKKDTRLEIFETVPPLIILTETAANRGNKDYTFSLTPQSKQTSDLVLFDMLLKADQDIEMELYWRSNENDGWTQLTSGSYSSFALDANELTSLCRLTGEDYKRFNQLEYIEYGIYVTRVGSDTEKEGWHTTVKIDVTCVAGHQAKLTGLFNGASSVGDGNVSNVNYSTQNPKDTTEFIVEMPFVDNIVPSFLGKYPIISNDEITDISDYMIMDTLIRPQLMTDRKATMYYLIAKKGTVNWKSKETYTNDKEMQEDLNKLAQAIRAHTLAPDGSFWGTFEITEGNSLKQPTFPTNGDLKAEENYEMFIVLKGVPTQLSQVYYREFKTTPTNPPEISSEVTAQGENYAHVQISTDKRAKVYWLILTKDQATIMKENETPEKQIEYIINGTKDETYEPYTYGQNITEASTTNYITTVKVDGIERPAQYVLVAVAQMMLSNGEVTGGYSKIHYSAPFTAKDVTAPKLQSFTSTTKRRVNIDNEWTVSGTISFTFSEPLYYMNSISSEDPQPVTEEFLKQLAQEMSSTNGMQIGFGDAQYATVVGDDGQPKKDDNGNPIKAAQSFKFTFSNVKNGDDTLVGTYIFCDANGNIYGQLYLQYKFAWDEKDKPIINADSTGGSTWTLQTLKTEQKQ